MSEKLLVKIVRARSVRVATIGLVLCAAGCAKNGRGWKMIHQFWGKGHTEVLCGDNVSHAQFAQGKTVHPVIDETEFDFSRDPFLNLQAPDPTLEITPAQKQESAAKLIPAEAASEDIYPLHLAQNEAEAVTEVSSDDALIPFDPEQILNSPPGEVPSTGSESREQLDRLRKAMVQDATQPMKPTTPATDLAATRVRTMLVGARTEMSKGRLITAYRLALGAESLAKANRVFFGPKEDTPADIIKVLKERLKAAEKEVIRQARSEKTPQQPEPEETVNPLAVKETEESQSEEKPSIKKTPPEVRKIPVRVASRAMMRAMLGPDSLEQALEAGKSPEAKEAEPRVTANGAGEVAVKLPKNEATELTQPKIEHPNRAIEPPVAVAKLPPVEIADLEPLPSEPEWSPAVADRVEPLPSGQPQATLKNVDWSAAGEPQPADTSLPSWTVPAILAAAILGLVLLSVFDRKRQAASVVK